MPVSVNAVLANFNWSSVAAWPLVMAAGFQVMLSKPLTVPVVLLMVIGLLTEPTVNVPAVPSITTGLVVPTVTTSAKPTVTSLPVLLTTTLPSPFILTVSPGLTLLAVPESVATVQPLLAPSILSLVS